MRFRSLHQLIIGFCFVFCIASSDQPDISELKMFFEPIDLKMFDESPGYVESLEKLMEFVDSGYSSRVICPSRNFVFSLYYDENKWIIEHCFLQDGHSEFTKEQLEISESLGRLTKEVWRSVLEKTSYQPGSPLVQPGEVLYLFSASREGGGWYWGQFYDNNGNYHGIASRLLEVALAFSSLIYPREGEDRETIASEIGDELAKIRDVVSSLEAHSVTKSAGEKSDGG